MKVQVLWRWVWLRTRDISQMQYSTARPVGTLVAEPPTAQVQDAVKSGSLQQHATATGA